MTQQEWNADGIKRFGPNHSAWRFVCPSCGHIASVKDWRDAGAPEDCIAFSCVGRWLKEKSEAFGKKKGGPCNYAGGGLFGLNPVEVEGGHYFDFAPDAARPSPTKEGGEP